ncbi:MAG TPA: transaldolase family protein, partial [Bryobacteraceae bacterium]|nr:transaldolase family protein [Bryobacteraceae bacterium]
EATLNALALHNHIDSILPADGGDCEETLSKFAKAGFDLDALAEQLQKEGAESFSKSWKSLMDVVSSKSAALKKAS